MLLNGKVDGMTEQLTNKDHDDLDALLGHLFDDYKAGLLTKPQAVCAIAHIVGIP